MGVRIEKVRDGDCETYPKKGQKATVHYVATLEDGTKFDSSRERGKPFTFKVGAGFVIRGWDEGITQMSVGERSKLICTPDFAYGPRGYPGVVSKTTLSNVKIVGCDLIGIACIPSNATLIFDVELIALSSANS